MIGLIVARSKNNVIGKNGEIPWKIQGEQKQLLFQKPNSLREKAGINVHNK